MDKMENIFQLDMYQYSSKKQLKECIKSFLTRAKDGEITREETIKKLHYLLLLHPEADKKTGCGIKGFAVTSNRLGSGKGFEVIRKDNTRERFSYKKCIDGESQTRRSKAIEALRFSVRQQMIDYRKSLKLPVNCAISGQLIENHDDLHIDHRIPFCELVSRFLNENNYLLNSFETSGSGENLIFVNKNISIEFSKFHKENAQLQPTLKECNIRKGGDKNY